MAVSPREWRDLVVAAVILTIVLIVCYMCIQLFKVRRKGAAEGFRGWVPYRPSCAGVYMQGNRRGSCRGLTTGEMPSIEEDIHISWAPCGGTLGVPPPTYS